MERLFGEQYALEEGEIHHHAAMLSRRRQETEKARSTATLSLSRLQRVTPTSELARRLQEEMRQLLEEGSATDSAV
jgi:hypothetical protein